MASSVNDSNNNSKDPEDLVREREVCENYGLLKIDTMGNVVQQNASRLEHDL